MLEDRELALRFINNWRFVTRFSSQYHPSVSPLVTVGTFLAQSLKASQGTPRPWRICEGKGSRWFWSPTRSAGWKEAFVKDPNRIWIELLERK